VRGLIALGLLLLGCTAQAASPERGRAIALDPARGDCAICHALPGGDVRNQGTIGPPLLNLAARYDRAALEARIANPKAFNSDTAMPAYGATEGLHRVPAGRLGRPILSADEIADVTAWLLEAGP
jgi:sulfur oxidation c-type cytochrome SoxX